MNKTNQFKGLSDRGKGILMSLGGVFVLSPDSLLIRLADLNDYTLIFYRGLFPIVAISLVLWIYYRTRFMGALLRIGWIGVLNGVLFALLSLIVLRENQRPSTWLIIALSLLSIFIIGWGSYGSNGLLGDFFAVCCAIFTACSAVLIRYKKDIDLVPSVIIGSLFTVRSGSGW